MCAILYIRQGGTLRSSLLPRNFDTIKTRNGLPPDSLPVDYASYTGRKSLAGKRLGVVRDLIEGTLADRDSVRIGNEALADMKQLGATVIDPVDFSAAIAEIMTAYEPSLVTQTFPVAIPAGVRPIGRLAAIAADPKLLPVGVRGVNLRMLAGQSRGSESMYAIDLYLKQRGDAKFRTVDDLYAPRVSPARTIGCAHRAARGRKRSTP